MATMREEWEELHAAVDQLKRYVWADRVPLVMFLVAVWLVAFLVAAFTLMP